MNPTSSLPDSRPDTEILRHALAEALQEMRLRTLELIEPLSLDDLFKQHDRLMSPIVWDIGHIGNFEELWGVRRFGGSLRPEYDEMYDAMKVPRAIRDQLPLPALDAIGAYLVEVRRVMLEHLDDADFAGDDELLREGYLYSMLLQHEYQHNETILATLQLKQGEPYKPVRRRELPEGNPSVGGMVTVPAGEFWMGTDDRGESYDNERPRHSVYLGEFQIGTAPVSNGEYMEFVESDGYNRREFWEEEGWAFIQENDILAPKHWERNREGRWTTRSMDSIEEVHPRRPVVHVCWYEAMAYARFVGKRLPTEAEWEKAASWVPGGGEQLKYPWGNQKAGRDHANLDQRGFGAAEIGAYPAGVSPVGCHQMLGDVWEWTSSDFTGYPGFEMFPYEEYSLVFFGPKHKVLRGGSWATRPGAIRNTFRNWDYPIRRQIFSGFRLAGDL